MKKDEFAEFERRWRRRSLFHEERVTLWRKMLWITLAIALGVLALYAWTWEHGIPFGAWLGQ